MNANQAQAGVNTLLQLNEPVIKRATTLAPEREPSQSTQSFERHMAQERTRQRPSGADPEPRERQAGASEPPRSRDVESPRSDRESDSLPDSEVDPEASQAPVTAEAEKTERETVADDSAASTSLEDEDDTRRVDALLAVGTGETSAEVELESSGVETEANGESSSAEVVLSVDENIESLETQVASPGAEALSMVGRGAEAAAAGPIPAGDTAKVGLDQKRQASATQAPAAQTALTTAALEGDPELNADPLLDKKMVAATKPENVTAESQALLSKLQGGKSPVVGLQSQTDQIFKNMSADAKTQPNAVTAAATVGAAVNKLTERLAAPLASKNTLGPLQTQVKTGFSQPQWGGAVAERVAFLASQRVSSAEIHLDPPELGPLQVKISVNQEQASVSFTAQHAVVREALDQNAFRLREMMDAEGLNLVDVNVSDQGFSDEGGEDDGSGQGQNGEPAQGDQGEEPAAPMRLSLVDHFV